MTNTNPHKKTNPHDSPKVNPIKHLPPPDHHRANYADILPEYKKDIPPAPDID